MRNYRWFPNTIIQLDNTLKRIFNNGWQHFTGQQYQRYAKFELISLIFCPQKKSFFSDNDAGQYGCRAINIAGVATQFFSVTISYECGKYDELGNIIALDEDCRHVFQTHGP